MRKVLSVIILCLSLTGWAQTKDLILGKFDFTLIDSTIQQARNLQLKVVFLWFGAWKILHVKLYDYK